MAVYLELTQEEIQKIAAGYGLRVSSFAGITQGVQNTNYLLNTDKGKFILTLCEPEISPAHLPFFNAAMLRAAQSGLPAPRPLKNKEGDFTSLVKNKPAGIVTFLEGAQQEGEASLDSIKQLGRFLALMHIKMAGFAMQRQNPLGFGGVKELLLKNKKLDAIAPGLWAEIAREIAFLEAAGAQNLPKGFIHADMFMDNIFFKNGEISGVIDFYFSCTDFLAYDLAVTANAWCFDGDGRRENKQKILALINAYNELRPLTPQERAAFPRLARQAALRFFATRAWDKNYPKPNALVGVKDPLEYIAKLRFWQTFKL